MTLGYVYKIYNTSNPDVFYIGSTKEELIKRLQGHKRTAKSRVNSKTKWFEYLRHHNYEGFRIVLVDTIDYHHKSQLRELEDHYIKELKPELNSKGSYQTEEGKRQYFQEYNQSEKRKESNKRYQQTEKYKQDYQRHNKQYNQQQNYVCEFCDYACAAECNFIRHLSSVKHRRAIEDAVDNGEECIYTGFTEEEVLQFHETVEEVTDE